MFLNPALPSPWPINMGGRRKKSALGATLLELTFAMAILATVMAVLFTLSIGIGDTAQIQDVRVTANDEGRRALLGIVPRLRHAQRKSVNFEDMPTDILTFRAPEDQDGNGLAVDAYNTLELGDEITVRRDIYDQNKDGRSDTQLIMIQGETITVLANNLSPDTGPAPVEEGEDPPENTAGFWLEENAGAVVITIRTIGHSRQGHVFRQTYTQLVTPRN